jgi:hypothetical protein
MGENNVEYHSRGWTDTLFMYIIQNAMLILCQDSMSLDLSFHSLSDIRKRRKGSANGPQHL